MNDPGDCRLLAIDDEPGLLSVVREAATQCGYEVLTTTQADEFLARAADWRPTLIIMDLQMPEVDGVELLRRLASNDIEAPIVLMSGVDDKLLRAVGDLGTELGLTMRGVLTKPIRFDTFRTTLTEHRAPTPTRTVDELRTAIDEDQLLLHYQPIMQLPQRSLVAVEALVRWHHPVRGLVPPDHFIPLAESNGMIDDVTDFVVRSAIEQAARWKTDLPVSVSINLSALNLTDASFPDRADTLCRELGVDPGRIWFELTETATTHDSRHLKTVLSRLRLKGFKLAIDDFGIGYSSMMQLRALPFTELKIDKSFVADMLTSEDAAIIVDAIIALAGAFRMTVVAEGIETEAQLAALIRRGCGMAQGYLLAKPGPAEQLEHRFDAVDVARH